MGSKRGDTSEDYLGDTWTDTLDVLSITRSRGIVDGLGSENADRRDMIESKLSLSKTIGTLFEDYRYSIRGLSVLYSRIIGTLFEKVRMTQKRDPFIHRDIRRNQLYKTA